MDRKEIARLVKLEDKVMQIAQEEGLLTTEVTFELVASRRMIEAIAYNFPTNFSHWSFGRDWERNRTIYENSGAGIPYEVVWNFENPRAFLVDTNPLTLNVMIMAHVLGHVDFFMGSKFLQRSREISDVAHEARNARRRFSGYERTHGIDEYEKVVEAAMSIQWLQDPDPFMGDVNEDDLREQLLALERAKLEPSKEKSSILKKPLTQEEIAEIEKNLHDLQTRTPPIPDYDILGYILRHSPRPLDRWEHDISSVIRNQARFLSPNRRTKLLNEGWATYWHAHIMRRLFREGFLNDFEHGVYNSYHSGVLKENIKGFNWYRIGFALFEDVKERWDKGQFGPEFENLKDPHKYSTWDKKAGKGNEKIFQMRTSYTDRMAIEELFSDQFIHGQRLYVWGERPNRQTGEIEDVIEESNPLVIRHLLRSSHTLYGIPRIAVVNGNHNNNGELYMKHDFSGSELNPKYEDGALAHVFRLWGRKVHLETIEAEYDQEGHITSTKPILHSYDGSTHTYQ